MGKEKLKNPKSTLIIFTLIIIGLLGVLLLLRYWAFKLEANDNEAQIWLDFFGWILTIIPLMFIMGQLLLQREQNILVSNQLREQKEQFALQQKSNIIVIFRKRDRYSDVNWGASDRLTLEIYNVGYAPAYDISFNLYTEGQTVNEALQISRSSNINIPMLRSQEVLPVKMEKIYIKKLEKILVTYSDPSDMIENKIYVDIPDIYLNV